MRTLIYVIVLFYSKLLLCNTIYSVSDGNWSSPNSWSSGATPAANDSVIINHEIYINASNAKCDFLQLNKALLFRSYSNKILLSTLSVSTGEVSGSNPGSIISKILVISDSLQLGKTNLTVLDSTVNYGHIIISEVHGEKQFGDLHNYGNLINLKGEKIEFKSKIINHGTINLLNTPIVFSRPAIIQSDNLISLQSVQSNSELTITDSVLITSAISAPKISNTGYLELKMTDAHFNVDSVMNFSTVCYSRKGQQTVQNISNDSNAELHFKNQGSFLISDSTEVSRIKVHRGATLDLLNYVNADFMVVKDSSKLSINTVIDGIKDFNLEKNSFLQINNSLTFPINLQKVGNIYLEENIELDLINLDTLKICGDFTGKGRLINSKVVEFCGTKKQSLPSQNFNHLVINNSATDELFLNAIDSIKKLVLRNGTIKLTDNFIDSVVSYNNSTINLTGYSPTLNHIYLNGTFNIHSNNALPHFKYIIISPSGQFNNNSSCDISVLEINNDGEFNGCNGTACDFTSPSDSITFNGVGTSYIPRLQAKYISNNSNLHILKSLHCDTLFNNFSASLFFEVDTQNFRGFIKSDAINNTFVLHKKGDQILPPALNTFHSLRISHNGEKKILSDIHINGDLYLDAQSIFSTDSFQVYGNNGKIILDSLATLNLGHNFSYKNIAFPLNFSKSSLHDYSTVSYQSKGNQTISTFPNYGNLILDDGAITKSTKVTDILNPLIIKGNLLLAESSLTFKNHTPVSIYKDLNGPGNLHTLDNIYLYGDGNGNGGLNQVKGSFIYCGLKPQRIKVASYNKLEITNPVEAYTRANTGELIVDTLNVLNGTLNFTTEKTTINNLNVWGNVKFSSKLQEKKFTNISIYHGGKFNFDSDETIAIKGNIYINGEFTQGNGRILFNDSLNNQRIYGNGSLRIKKIDISKLDQMLKIESIIELNDTINLKSGKIVLEDGQIEIKENGFIIGESETNFITGNANGKIFTNLNILPGIYENIAGTGLTISTETAFFNTNITRGFTPQSLMGEFGVKRYYIIEPTIKSGHQSAISFPIWDHELNNVDTNNLKIWKTSDGSNWQMLGGNYSSESNTITLNNVSSFSKWTAGGDIPVTLSVELLNFYGKRNGENIELSWKVNTEVNTQRYLIKYSTNGYQFDSLTTIFAGNQFSYSFNHPQFYNSGIYYELIEVEYDGKKVRLDTIYIPPSNNHHPYITFLNGNIKLYNINTGTFLLYNQCGQLISKQSIRNKIAIPSLSKGIYYVKLINEIGSWEFKIVN